MITKADRKKIFKKLYQDLNEKIWAIQKQSGLASQEFFKKHGFSEKTFRKRKRIHFTIGILQQIVDLLLCYDLCPKIEFVPLDIMQEEAEKQQPCGVAEP